MSQSEKLDQLLPAFAAAQMDYPDFIKNRTGQFKYMDLVEMVGTVKPILFKHGLMIYHKRYIHEDNLVSLGTILSHFPSEQFIEDRVWVEVDLSGKRSPLQEFGSAISYHKRYAIMSLLCLTPEDSTDDDGGSYYNQSNNDFKSKHTGTPGLATDKQKWLLKKLLNDANISPTEYYKKHNIEKPEDLTASRISQMIEELK